METILHDIRFALRGLAKRPGFTLVALLTLTLGIGANVAIFSVVEGVVLRPLPYDDADRLVRLQPDGLFPSSLDEALYLDERAASFDGVAAWGRALFLLDGEEPEELRGAVVDPHHFAVLGAPPALGRGFEAADGLAGAAPVVILGHGLWQRRFGGDPGVVGRQVTISGRSRTVVGVLGADHQRIEEDWQVWAPMVRDAAGPDAERPLAVNARLAPGVELAAAQDEVRALLARRWRELGRDASDAKLSTVRLVPLRDWLLGDAALRLLLLLGAVALVLLIACINIANLLLARGGARRHELSVRTALGAGRGRLVRLLLTESVVLGVLGGVLGLGAGALLLRVGLGHLPPDIPRADGIALDGTVLAFAAASSLLAAILFGLVPAWRAARGADLELRSRDRSQRPSWAGHALVAGEVALALTVVVGAGLMVKSFAKLDRVNPGFEAAGVVTVRPSPARARYGAQEQLDTYYRQVTDAVAAVPGVESVGAIQFLPMTSGGSWDRYRTTPRREQSGDLPGTSVRVVTPGYFETLRIPRLAGRAFDEQDIAGAPRVVVVNRTLAEAAWPGQEAVGKTLLLGSDEPAELRVVGVVGDVRQSRLAEPAFAEAYLPFAQAPWSRMFVAARVDPGVANPASRIAAVREAVLSVDRRVAVSGVGLFEDFVGRTAAGTGFLAALLSAFGGLALVLGAIGVYGVTAQGVVHRRRELGIRMALGASGSDLLRATLLRGSRPVAVGLVVGTAGALWTGRWLEALLFEVTAADPAVLVSAAATLAAAAWLALVGPARRASRVDPMTVLRDD